MQSFETIDGVNVLKAAVITAEEYPEYRALELETWWLECKVHLRKQQEWAQQPGAK